MFDLIRLSLWNQGSGIADKNTYEEMKKQAIATLPIAYLNQLDLPSGLKKEWNHYALQQLAYYTQYKFAECNLPIKVPYVIIKGTSAAQYYPHPEHRTMGDIDIITRREDFDIACQQLKSDGYRITKELNREIGLIKNNVIVEMHRRFATLNNPDKAKYLDDLIIENINPSHILPDMINGLVLLEHIDQHLEGGLGMRQIIDWMMFVDKCLPDDKWLEFEALVDNIGLKKLAITTTRMCEIYLGLAKRKWCSEADKDLCEQLMDYVVSSGNFGNKKTTEEAISENVFAYASTPKMAIRLLQRRGLANWNAVKKYKILRPFAWIYQVNRYIIKGLKRGNATIKLKTEYEAARKRNAMFDALGVKTAAKGIVLYKDGKYVSK